MIANVFVNFRTKLVFEFYKPEVRILVKLAPVLASFPDPISDTQVEMCRKTMAIVLWTTSCY